MAGAPTFPLTVDGIGDFVFRRRTLDAQFKIQAAAVRLLGGETVSDQLHVMAIAIETVRHLTEMAPDDWDLDAIDPLDQDAIQAVMTVFGRLRAAEDTFRAGSQSQRKNVGPRP